MVNGYDELLNDGEVMAAMALKQKHHGKTPNPET